MRFAHGAAAAAVAAAAAEEEEEERDDDPFVIFSGGKLEFRKGQDLVVAAFRAFLARYPGRRAKLLTNWYHKWPSLVDIGDPRAATEGSPRVVAGEKREAAAEGATEGLDLVEWMGRNGLDATVWADAGQRAPQDMPALLREADVALFPNRCEGGNNLVAMESIASGVPVILSANTGHLDIIAEIGSDVLFPLVRQGRVPPASLAVGETGERSGGRDRGGSGGGSGAGTGGSGAGNGDGGGRTAVAGRALAASSRGWGESEVAEIVEKLDFVYTHRGEARRRAATAVRRARRLWSWTRRVDAFVAALKMWELERGGGG